MFGLCSIVLVGAASVVTVLSSRVTSRSDNLVTCLDSDFGGCGDLSMSLKLDLK